MDRWVDIVIVGQHRPACITLHHRPTHIPPRQHTRQTHTHTQIEEQDKILAARRSNNLLDTTKIVAALQDVHIPEIHEACEGVRCARVSVCVCVCVLGACSVGRLEHLRVKKPAALRLVCLGRPSLPIQRTPPTHFLPHQVFKRMRVNLEKEGVWPDKLPKRANSQAASSAAPPSS